MKEARKAYQTDLSDAEWQILKPLLPGPRADGRGRPMLHDLREIVNAILYVLHTGIQWRLMPHDLPPWSTVYYHFRKWHKNGIWEEITAALREQLRVQEGREPTPSAAIIDSQSVKSSMNKGVHGYDGAKSVNGRKRHLAVDTLGLLLVVVVTAADVAERERAKKLFAKLAQGFKRLKLIWADAVFKAKTLLPGFRRLINGCLRS
jgi:putative transposase